MCVHAKRLQWCNCTYVVGMATVVVVVVTAVGVGKGSMRGMTIPFGRVLLKYELVRNSVTGLFNDVACY